MGSGEIDLTPFGSQVSEPLVPAVGTSSYTKTISFVAGNVPAGLYEATVIVTMTGPNPPAATAAIAGFANLGLVQFYDEP
jgi:hypothetical protein